MNFCILPITVVILFSLFSCVKKEDPIARCPITSLSTIIQMAKTKSEEALNAPTVQNQIEAAKKGIAWGEKCVQLHPQEAACYYYRAVNTGLYFEAAPFYYQKGLKKIINDSEKVIILHEAYEGGGGYRILGNIYLRVPSFSLSRKAILKDLDKAESYAMKAFEIAPHDSENLLLLAEVLMDQEKPEEAVLPLQSFLEEYQKKGELTPWEQKNKKRALKLLAQVEKKLTKKEIR